MLKGSSRQLIQETWNVVTSRTYSNLRESFRSRTWRDVTSSPNIRKPVSTGYYRLRSIATGSSYLQESPGSPTIPAIC
eukprot:1164193-Amorphochlora_amoeboformis.AAC.1